MRRIIEPSGKGKGPFTESTASYDKAAVIVLNSPGKDFGSRCGKLIGYYDHTSVGKRRCCFCHERMLGRAASGSAYDRSIFRKELACHIEGSPKIASAVVGEIYDKILHALLLELGYGLAYLLACFLGKSGDTDISGRRIGHESLVDTVERNIVADNAETDRISGTLHFKIHHRAFRPAEMLHHIGIDHLLAGQYGIVCTDNAVAGHNTDLLRRASGYGLDDIDSVLKHIELNAYAAELALERLSEFFRLGRRGICRMRIESLEHGLYGLSDKSVGINIFYIEILDHMVGHAQFRIRSNFLCGSR